MNSKSINLMSMNFKLINLKLVVLFIAFWCFLVLFGAIWCSFILVKSYRKKKNKKFKTDLIILLILLLSFQQRLESLQYKALLALAGAIKSSIEKLFQELGLKSLQNKRWFRKLFIFYKIIKKQYPIIRLLQLTIKISSNSNSYQTTNSQNLVIPQLKIRNNFFINSFLHQQ